MATRKWKLFQDYLYRMGFPPSSLSIHIFKNPTAVPASMSLKQYASSVNYQINAHSLLLWQQHFISWHLMVFGNICVKSLRSCIVLLFCFKVVTVPNMSILSFCTASSRQTKYWCIPGQQIVILLALSYCSIWHFQNGLITAFHDM